MIETVPDQSLRTEYPFVLPRGYVDRHGEVHRTGAMRLATAKDELSAQLEPKVQQNPLYLSVYLLAGTVTGLGTLYDVEPAVIESLFASDMAFLQDLYRRINQAGHAELDVVCPRCEHAFVVDVAGDEPGES